MRLELHKLPIENVCWGERTHVKDRTLVIDREKALAVVSGDSRFASASLELARPGESVRIIPVKDAVEPRCKLEGPGEVFPGVLGQPPRTVGEGKTLVLEGAAVLTCGSIVAFQEGFVDMSGPGAAYTPFSETQNVVLMVEPREGLDQHEYEAALREAGLKLALHLARECKDTPAEKVEVFDLPSVGEVQKAHPELPGIVYIFMCITQGLLHDTYLYGVDVKQTLPALVHPNEIMDGALISGNCVSACDKNTTWHHVNNPVVAELYRRHGVDLNFLGVIVTPESTTLAGKERATWYNAKLAAQLGARGAVVSEEGYGNPDTDLCMNAKKLEDLGIRTVVISDEAAGTDGKSQGLADATPEMTAFISTGNVNEMIEVPPMERVLGHPEAIAHLSGGADESLRKDGSMYVELQSVIGSTNELGFSRIGCRWI